MYEFRDTIAAVVPDNGRSAESLCINGVWLEDVIPGFRVLNVKGRESYVKNVSTYTVADTEYYKKAVYKPRTIEVTYRLIAADNEAFREAFNTLNMYLAAEEAQLIFADEDDKYFIGTASDADAVPSGRNRITSSISFLCTDPRKYALEQKTFMATASSGLLLLEINNTGNTDCDIDYTISHSGDNGYIGIASVRGGMQYGNTSEIDKETVPSQKTIGWATGQDLYDHGTKSGAGTWGVISEGNQTYLRCASITASSHNWSGPTISFNALDTNNDPARDFRLYTKLWFEAGSVSHTGAVAVRCYTSGNEPICQVVLSKTSKENDHYYLEFYIGGVCVERILQYANALGNFRRAAGVVTITKEGPFFTFNYSGGRDYSYRNDDYYNSECASVRFDAMQYDGATNYLTRMYMSELGFRKNNSEYENNIPNRFSSGDVLRIRGNEARAYLNDMPTDEQLGSIYFKSPPGTMTVDIHPSSWAWDNGTPRISARALIREAWI